MGRSWFHLETSTSLLPSRNLLVQIQQQKYQNNGRFGVFIVNFEQISHIGASFVDLEQVYAGWIIVTFGRETGRRGN